MHEKKLSVFERYLTLWVLICIGAGIFLGKIAPGVTVKLDSLSIYNVSIPIAICFFFMIYPIMVKIDFTEVVKAAKLATTREVISQVMIKLENKEKLNQYTHYRGVNKVTAKEYIYV